MLRKIHGTNFFNIKILDRPNIKCQNGPVLPPAQVFYFNGQALPYVCIPQHKNKKFSSKLFQSAIIVLLFVEQRFEIITVLNFLFS
jgi:hypothetical protein